MAHRPDRARTYWWQQALRRFDDVIMSASTRIAGPRSSLIILMFHGLYRDEAEAFTGHVDPYQPLTEADLVKLIQCFHQAGYRFITPDDLHGEFAPDARCVLLTFDDGYANNLRAVPILKRFDVPATFFIATGNVASGEAFWWDVLYRERVRRQTNHAEIVAERQKLKTLDSKGIKARLQELFGEDAFTPASETDRPMTVTELQSVAQEPLITLGNHTVDHELLTRIPLEEARQQIVGCQEMLTDWTGTRPRIIAYPNGIHNAAIVEAAEQAGLTAGLISLRGRTSLPFKPGDLMRLPRFALNGGANTERDCRVVMAPFSLSGIKQAIHSRRQQRALP